MEQNLKIEVKNFNESQLEGLNKIMKIIKAKDVKKRILYFTEDSYEICEPEDGSDGINDYLNYPWVEFRKDDQEYRITMFYKDFDHGSGNIHILPGAIQVWKKMNNTHATEDGFCERDLLEDNRLSKEEYKAIGGKPYCEFDWCPLLSHPVFWEEKDLPEIAEKINDGRFNQINTFIHSNKFYEKVKAYSSEGRSGHYMKYSLLKFNTSAHTFYYRTMCIKDIGYFTKYDGQANSYANNNNLLGPNYYDKKWLITINCA